MANGRNTQSAEDRLSARRSQPQRHPRPVTTAGSRPPHRGAVPVSSTERQLGEVRPAHTSHRAAVRMLAVTRDTCDPPKSVTTGTPIHDASNVVVVPLYGNGSSATSTSP